MADVKITVVKQNHDLNDAMEEIHRLCGDAIEKMLATKLDPISDISVTGAWEFVNAVNDIAKLFAAEQAAP